MKPSIVIDTRGMFCPIPVLKMSEALQRLDGGARVELISDDPAAEYDVPAWCQSHGHTIETVKKEGDTFRYVVRKRT